MLKSNVQPHHPAVEQALADIVPLMQTELLQAQSIVRLAKAKISDQDPDCAFALGTAEDLLDRCWDHLNGLPTASDEQVAS